MPWWNEVLSQVNTGEILYTPGRGIPPSNQKPFTIITQEPTSISILSGKSVIPLERECFDVIEKAFNKNSNLCLRVASVRETEPLENSVDELIRNATESQLSRGNYISSILEYCGIVRYTMLGNQKHIELVSK